MLKINHYRKAKLKMSMSKKIFCSIWLLILTLIKLLMDNSLIGRLFTLILY